MIFLFFRVSSHIFYQNSFGYLDGVSNPAIIGFDTNPPPGPAPIRPGVIVVGHDGDPNVKDRDDWMIDGSFFVFRYLFQKVPEFDDFVDRNKLNMPGLTEKENADLLGARLVGRWKSGQPGFVFVPRLKLLTEV